MRITAVGDRALMVEFDDIAAVVEHYAGWRAGHPGVADLVPAARTILVLLTEDADAADVRNWLARTPPRAASTTDQVLDIDVIYDGPDLDALADELTLDIVAHHTGTVWTSAFIGFAPGFAYLVGGELNVPRLSTPRVSVPAGSVALAGEFTGIYPSATPGGWRLIGRTDTALWDIERDPPALLTPGTRVRFHAVGA